MDNAKILNFLLAYTKGVDMINCVDHAIENNFSKPDDYEDYGCNIDFIASENSSIKDRDGLKEWFIQHHNTFVKQKINPDSPMGFCFPPPYNFISNDDISIPSSDAESAVATVMTGNGTYVFHLESSSENEYGMIIKSVYMEPQWGGDLIPIIE